MNVFITGVSSGIGFGLTKKLLDEGHRVAGVSRREIYLNSAWQFHHAPLDITQSDRVEAVVQSLNAKAGPFDLAILNAGALGVIQDMRDASIAAMQETMDVNVWANKTVIDALTALDSPPKQIVAISSGAAVNGNRGWNGYAISKAALNMLIRLYAVELPEIHFSAIAPGLVDTAMQDYLCGLDASDQFQSLGVLQSKRNTPEMPNEDEVAPRLWDAIQRIPNLIDSGDFVDIRKPPICS